MLEYIGMITGSIEDACALRHFSLGPKSKLKGLHETLDQI